MEWSGRLLEMLRDELRHLEHADLALATENGAKLVVRIDHRALGLVLKLVLLDVRPKLLRDLRTRNRLRTDDLGERARRRERLHERCVRLALRGLLLRRGLAGALLCWHAPLLSCAFADPNLVGAGWITTTLLGREQQLQGKSGGPGGKKYGAEDGI